MGKAVGLFETCRKVGADVDGEECLNVIHEGDGASVGGVPFRYKGDGEFFGRARDDAMDKGVVNDLLSNGCPLRWETCENIKREAPVAS